MQKEIKYWYLRNYDMFAQLAKEEVHYLCQSARFLRIKKGQSLFFQNDDKKKIYFLINGKLKLSELNGLGNEMVKDILLTGDLFGDLDFVSSNSNQEYVEVLSSEVIVCVFEMDEFETILQKYPHLALSFAKRMNQKLKQIEYRYSNLVFKDVKDRLLSFLTDWAKREGKHEEEGTVIKNYLTHQEIASLISSSRQTVTTLINELKTQGSLLYSRSKIIIPDVKRLAA